MKIIFITTTFYLIYLMRFKAPISQTYDRATDSFQYELYLLPPCFVLGLLCTEEYTIPDILWTSSIWLESVAIIPQLVLLQKERTWRILLVISWEQWVLATVLCPRSSLHR